MRCFILLSRRQTAAVLLLLAAVFAGAACSRTEPTEAASVPKGPVELRVVRTETRDIETSIPITGSLLSTVQVDVKTEQPGRLLQAPPREGEQVARGQVIARLDDTNYRLAARQAGAGVSVGEAALERARAGVQHADRELERARSVQASGGITVKDFQAAEWAARDARAQQQLAEAQLQQARETLAVAEKRLRDCVIVAPISGVVQTHLQNAGIYLDTRETLVRLVDNGQLELEATVPSAELGRLRAGQAVRFSVDSFPGTMFSGRLVNMAPAVAEQTRSVKVRVSVPNPDRRLKAGMFVRGAIVTGSRKGALLLPLSAIQRDAVSPAKGTVVVVENGVARRRQVQLGMEQSGWVEVLNGVAASDPVVAEPQVAPGDGQAVRMQTAKPM